MKKLSVLLIAILLICSMVSCKDNKTTTTTEAAGTGDTSLILGVGDTLFSDTLPANDPYLATVATIVAASNPTKSVTSVASYHKDLNRTLSSSEIYRVDDTHVLFEYSYEKATEFVPGVSDGSVVIDAGQKLVAKSEFATGYTFKLTPSALSLDAENFEAVASIYAEASDTINLRAKVKADKIDTFLGVDLEDGCIVEILFVCDKSDSSLLSVTVAIQYANGNSLQISSNYSYDAQTFAH